MGHKSKTSLSFIFLLPFLHLTSSVHCLKNSLTESLDTILHDHAVMTHHRRHTNELYEARLPEYLAGIKVSAVELRSRTLWKKGANFSGIFIPPNTLPVPYVKRLLIVYHNLGNCSSTYYTLPGYTLLTPVLGFSIYDASYSSNKNYSKINLNTNGKSITISFNNSSSDRGNQIKKCAVFVSPRHVSLNEVRRPNMCYSRSQGHFCVVIPFKERHKMSLLWIVVGFMGLILVGLGGIVAVRSILCKRTQKMEKEADEGEFLQTYWISISKMPRAEVTRTRPVLESKSLPSPKMSWYA